METSALPEVIKDYLDAFEARDLERCLALCDDNATLVFGPGHYQGRDGLEQWHKARWAVGLRVLTVDDVKQNGDTVTVQGMVTSQRLKLWHLKQTKATATFKLRDGKIADLRFAARLGNPHELMNFWKR